MTLKRQKGLMDMKKERKVSEKKRGCQKEKWERAKERGREREGGERAREKREMKEKEREHRVLEKMKKIERKKKCGNCIFCQLYTKNENHTHTERGKDKMVD